MYYVLSVVRVITLVVQAFLPVPAHFFVTAVYRSVSGSVVCLSHYCATFLNRLTNLDAISQVHLCYPWTHCVLWGSLPPEDGEP